MSQEINYGPSGANPDGPFMRINPDGISLASKDRETSSRAPKKWELTPQEAYIQAQRDIKKQRDRIFAEGNAAGRAQQLGEGSFAYECVQFVLPLEGMDHPQAIEIIGPRNTWSSKDDTVMSGIPIPREVVTRDERGAEVRRVDHLDPQFILFRTDGSVIARTLQEQEDGTLKDIQTPLDTKQIVYLSSLLEKSEFPASEPQVKSAKP